MEEIAASLTGMSLGRPVRLAIDGRTASGKTFLGNEIAATLRAGGRPIIRASLDAFHRPQAERYARGRYSAQGYYEDAQDLPAVAKLLLDPLGPHGDRMYRTKSFDLKTDAPVEQESRLAPADAILVFDGPFLQRPELRDAWDVTLFVEISEQTSQRRGVPRDAARLAGEQNARRLYTERYGPAFDLYEQTCAPEKSADIVLVNDDVQNPQIHVRPNRRSVSRS